MTARRRGAFTLVEMMLAITILAVLMVLLWGVVYSTVQADRRVEEVRRGSELGPVILALIREDLEGAILPPAKEGDEAPRFRGVHVNAGSGDHDRLDFVAERMAYGAVEEHAAPAFHSVNETGYQVLDNPRRPGEGILYRRQDFFVDLEPLKGGVITELYDRVTHFDVKYWQAEEWVEEWTAQGKEAALPQAVRIEIRFRIDRADGEPEEKKYLTTVTFPK